MDENSTSSSEAIRIWTSALLFQSQAYRLKEKLHGFNVFEAKFSI